MELNNTRNNPMRQDEEATRIFYYEAKGHIQAKLRAYIRNCRDAMAARTRFAAEQGANGVAGYEGVYYVLGFSEAPCKGTWRFDDKLRGFAPRLATPEGRELHRCMFTAATKVPTMASFCRSINFDPWQEYPAEVFPGLHQVDGKLYISLPPYFKPRTCRLLTDQEAKNLVKKVTALKPRTDERRLATA